VPYCFILTCPILRDETLPASWEPHLSTNGSSYGIDFAIGDRNILGKGLASPTLVAFTDFFRREVDPTADVFLIDPDMNNPRAIHVYAKAGFERVATFEPTRGVFIGQPALLMVKRYGEDTVTGEIE
jgi:RimJ/RimL family protein N-acetyltransferase